VYHPIAVDLRHRQLHDVASVATNPHQKTQYLLGAEPVWADIQSGRAVERRADQDIWEFITRTTSQAIPGVLMVTGTAGSGKSTSLKRACLRLVAEGKWVSYADREDSLSPREIRLASRGSGAPPFVALDDADVYGSELSNMIREITTTDPFSALDASDPLRADRQGYLATTPARHSYSGDCDAKFG
jgi:hypothetical protein